MYFQFFSGQVYFELRLPCDPAQISSFWRVLGEGGFEQLLKTRIEAAVDMGAVKKTAFERVIVDTTVQSNAIAHPTDSRRLEVARDKLARLAKRVGMQLKQTHESEGKTLHRKAGGYAHAKQSRRLCGVPKRQRKILGRLLRKVRCKMSGLADEDRVRLDTWVQRAERISKGQARSPYEFGVKSALPSRTSTGWWPGGAASPATRMTGTHWPRRSSRPTPCCRTSG